VNLPGLNEVFPPNFQNIRGLSYQGQRQSIVQGLDPYAEPIQVSHSFTRVVGPYLEARSSGSGDQSPVSSVKVAGIVGSLWMNPQTLQKHAKPAELDRDPQTGAVLSTQGVWNNLTVFTVETPLSRQMTAYDTSNGILMQSEFFENMEAMNFVTTYSFAGAQ
jgi:hypothetical protein